MIRDVATGSASGPHRAVLKELGAAAGMTETVRWEEKVGQRRQPAPEDPEAKEVRWQEFQRIQELRRAEVEELQRKEEWEKNPQQVRARVQERLDHLTFDQMPERTAGMDARTRFMLGFSKQSGIDPRVSHPHEGLAMRFIERFSDKKAYGDGMSGSSLGNLGNASGTVFLNGLGAARMLANLEGALGEGSTEEELAAMYEKLLSSGRYRLLKDLEKNNSLTEEEQTELETYDATKVEALDAKFDEGMQELKKIQYRQICRLRDKYGRYGSQLHPEDFASRMGLEFFDDIQADQDMIQVLADGSKYFDFENNPEDQEIKNLVEYFTSVINITFAYLSMPDPGAIDFLEQMSDHQKIRELESSVKGEGLTEQEQKAYYQNLQEQVQNGGPAVLFGRFKEVN